jgi:hypothetical protein
LATRQDLSGKRLADRDSPAHDGPQDPNTEVSKVLRLTLDSKPAPGNPLSMLEDTSPGGLFRVMPK